MKRHHGFFAAIAAIFSCAVADAAPMIQFANDTGSSVTLQIVTDVDGSIAAELAVTVETTPGLMLTGATPNLTDFFPNPGDNPFIPGLPIGGDTTGLFTDFPAGQVFAAYGSVAPMTPASTYDFLTLDYTGAGDLLATGIVAQLGSLGDTLTARTTLVPEPSTALLIAIGALSVTGRRRTN